MHLHLRLDCRHNHQATIVFFAVLLPPPPFPLIANSSLMRTTLTCREERLSAGSAYVERSEEFTDKQNILYRTNELGRRVQDIGGFGRGQPQWWALWVKEGREKQVADALHRRTPFLPALELNPAHFGFDIEAMEAAASQGRKLETWVPEKKVRAWNPK